MGGLGQYLFTVVCAAIIASFTMSVTADKGAPSALIRMLGGMLVVITMIVPLKQISLIDITDYWEGIKVDASIAITDGENSARNELIKCIVEQTEEYILDKATSLDLDISVQVSVSNGEPPVPTGVIIKGNAAPYARTKLLGIISAELGIAEANILWN